MALFMRRLLVGLERTKGSFPQSKWIVSGCSMQRKLTSSSSPQDEPLTITTQTNGIRRIHLNDPKKRNALSLAMINSIMKDLTNDVDDLNLRVIVLSASGPVFSAGHDLKELTSSTGRNYHRKVFETCSEMMLTIQDLPVPVIAQVQGLATAGGCQLVATCDLVVASEDARFATPGASVGLFCSTPAVAVARSVPQKLALEMLFVGEPISAQAALQNGLVNRVVPAEKLEEETITLASKICRHSRSVIALGKSAFYKQINEDVVQAYNDTCGVMVDNLSLVDGQEGIGSFFEKRKPAWTHTNEKAHD